MLPKMLHLKMKFELIDEFKLSETEKLQVAEILKECFPLEEFYGRTYFKQLPHYRLLLKDGNKIIGQIRLDYRFIKLNNQVVRVLGIIDLAVLPEYQGQGFGTKLLAELDKVVNQYPKNIDFLFLVADKHKFYERNGYKLTKQKVKWLTIEEHINYGLQENVFTDCLMYKQVGQIEWTDNSKLDMFGY